ncbi:MAG: thymidine phosphorylase [Xanthomonadales bacterium]|jgi:thymidine phosphorylase|nr:thymidine phosphorylase [Xanthomonadales bacterium]
MIPAEKIIRKKRDGLTLSAAEIADFVNGVSSGDIGDAQIAAFTMATWFNGMSDHEAALLTLAMRDSGSVLDWPGLDGPVLDKHSTGGVGDLVSLVLGPIVASCGGYVPMISGRGLGHTGGTLDKLESIPGFDTTPGIEHFAKQVRDLGIAIVGQTDELAPADRRIYAVRDVTATVSSPPLMISSILSKKLAEGLDGLVLDIKYGSGAFTADAAAALELAAQMSSVAANAGVACNALVTDMNLPLAWSAGNAVEVREAIRFLAGEEPHPRLEEVSMGLSGELLQLGGLAASAAEGRRLAAESISSGRAAEKFARMVHAQGGPADLLERSDVYLPGAHVVRPVAAHRAGFISAIDTTAVGNVVVSLGGGRARTDDIIDPRVGLTALLAGGDQVERGAPLAVVHAADEAGWQRAAQAIVEAYTIRAERPLAGPVVHSRVEGVASNEAR